MDDGTPELPMRITNSFPPRGIVAKVLTNSQNTKGSSLCLCGSFKEHPIAHKTRLKIQNEEDARFSLPQTLTEKNFRTRKTPRFYTVDTSSLQQQDNKVDHALNQLITNSDLTGLQEIYQRICKGSPTTLQTLISKKKISQKFVFVQNSSPLTRYHHQARRPTAKEEEPGQITVDQQCRNLRNSFREKTSEKISKRVLVPSPYFNSNSKTVTLSTPASQHILYSSRFDKNCRSDACKCPFEPTVINLNYKLPELPKDLRSQNSRFLSKNTTKNQRWGSSVIKSPDCGKKLKEHHRHSRDDFANPKRRNEKSKDLQP